MKIDVPEKRWNDIYKKQGTSYSSPLDYMPELTDIFRRHGTRKVLDLACGSGNHLAYLAENGFDTYGMDLSKEGIRTLMKEKNLRARCVVGSMYGKLPFRENSFDAVLCLRAIHHGRIEDIRMAISDMERVLKPSGIVYVTVRKRVADNQRLPYEIIAPNTYVPTEGREIGVVHYLFDEESLRKEFRNFDIPKIWVDEHSYYCFTGELIK